MEISEIIEKVNEADLSQEGKNEVIVDIKNELATFNKPNDITIKGHFDFEPMEEDMVNYFLYNFNKIDHANKNNISIEFDVKDIIKFFRMPKGGERYESIKQAFKNIRDKSIWWYNEENGKRTIFTFAFFTEVEVEMREDYIDKNTGELALPKDYEVSGKIKCKISEKSYNLIDEAFKKYYSTFNIRQIYDLKNKYAKRLYQMLYAYYKQETSKEEKKGRKYIDYVINESDLRERLKTKDPKYNKDIYKDPKEFKKSVVKKAVDQINETTDGLTVLFRRTKKAKYIFAISGEDSDTMKKEEEKRFFEEVEKRIDDKILEEQSEFIKNSIIKENKKDTDNTNKEKETKNLNVFNEKDVEKMREFLKYYDSQKEKGDAN